MNFVIRRLNKSCYERQDKTHPARSPLHCFFYLSEGSVLVDIGEVTYFMQEDDLIIIPAGQIFKVRYYENSKGYMGGFQIPGIALPASLSVWQNPKFILPADVSAHIASLLERLAQVYGPVAHHAPAAHGQHQASAVHRTGEERIVEAYLQAFLAEVEAVRRHGKTQTAGHNDATCGKFFELLFHSGSVASDSSASRPSSSSSKNTVAYYAQRLGITPNHLNKVVKSYTGKSPSVWIEEAVIQQAKHLLKTTTLSLGEIASIVGILDQSYFARRFKMHEGVTPREWRNRLSGYKND